MKIALIFFMTKGMNPDIRECFRDNLLFIYVPFKEALLIQQ